MPTINLDTTYYIVHSWQIYLQNQKLYSTHTLRAYYTDLASLISFLLNKYPQQQNLAQQHNTTTQTNTPTAIKCRITDARKKHLLEVSRLIQLNTLQTISSQDIREWLSQLKGSSRSKSRALSSVRNFFKYIEQKYSISNDNINNIKLRIKSTTLPKTVNFSQAMSAIHSATVNANTEKWLGLRDKAILLLIYGCGLRISEAISLRLADIEELDHKQHLIRIHGKGNKDRVLPLFQEVYIAIKDYVNSCPYAIQKNTPMFWGARGKTLNPNSFRIKLKTILQTAGISTTISPHSFRHAFASHLLEQGVPIKTIQQALGHESVSSTQIYTKIAPASLKKVYDLYHPGNSYNTNKTSESDDNRPTN